MELEETWRSTSMNSVRDNNDDEIELQWAAIERLPTFERLRTSLFDHFEDQANGGTGDSKGKRPVDVTKLGRVDRQMFIEKLIKQIENDNLRLLQRLRKRIDRVGVKLPTVEVRYRDLRVEAVCKVVDGKSLPTLWNTFKSFLFGLTRLLGAKDQEAKISIIKSISGIIKPSRMTLLLGPPGCGKTTLLLALAGKLDQSLKVQGEISYNGYRLDESVPQKTSAYISQYDLHIPEMTVREIGDFSARCQGVGSRAEIMMEVSRREKQAGIVPEADIDTYMKATSIHGLKRNLQTDYILKILGLDICADILVGDAMRRGISGGQKKRLTTGEMIVGPIKALLMDEISTGLDSSTTFQIVAYLQQLVHITDVTALISLLQPAPETYDLFDDILLMAEGKIVYHGPRSCILEFFKNCGFSCPERKAAADFLQEVLSQKDQPQYWCHTDKPYAYVSVDEFSEYFKGSALGQKLHEELSSPFDKSQCHNNAMSLKATSLSKWELFKACMARELLLTRRNSFVYIFKSTQMVILASITMTVFLRTQLQVNLVHANYYMGSLFYAIMIIMFDGFPEVSMTISRLPIFFKQRDFYLYPSWAYAIPAFIVKIPISILQALVWTVLTYYVIGYSPEAWRFFRQFLLLFAVHHMATSMFRFTASVFQTVVASTFGGGVIMFIVFLFGGFILPRTSMPAWLRWGFWVSPMTYCQIGIAVNEFLAPRWQKISSGNTTLGLQTLKSRGLDFGDHFYWISLGALFGFSILYNIGFIAALAFLQTPGRSDAIISREKLFHLEGKEEDGDKKHVEKKSTSSSPKTAKNPRSSVKMVFPFQPLTVAFKDVQYYIDTPKEMKEQGIEQKKLLLLQDITGAFRPGILTALMGVSGAGKTTLMDVLSGRKTNGSIEGVITIGGYPKVQETFARISGYCEQTDIHSPQITVEESVVFSAWLRLPPEIDKRTKAAFVDEVLETIELDGIKDALVGIPSTSGLSIEQRKRLTIAVEFVANPSVIFMDEPTSGLDARAAAIVMRAVKNEAHTGRTVVCTIHQPSIDIFESFDELFLMKKGGQIIYSGPLGQHSSRVIEYFEKIPGIPKIKDNYNPGAWMLEVTTISMENQLGIDFAGVYGASSLFKDNGEMVNQLTMPPPRTEELCFPTPFPQNGWEQFKACLWKQSLSYWRRPSYNLARLTFLSAASMCLGAVFWKQGKKINTQQDLFNIVGGMFTAIVFVGVNNCSSVLPLIATERSVLYREKFAGMYSPMVYSFAQVAVELPYAIVLALLFLVITYPTIGYDESVNKILWYFYITFCTLLYYNYLGMLLMSMTPNIQVDSILASASYTILNLFSGFLIPQPQIPKWWVWLYWICPTSWTLKGYIASQYWNVEKEIPVFGENKPVATFLNDYFGYHHNQLGIVAVALGIYPLIFASLFTFSIGKLNFQRR